MSDVVGICLIGYGKMGKAIHEIAKGRKDVRVICIHEKSFGENVDFPLVPSIEEVCQHPEVDVIVDYTHQSAFNEVVSTVLAYKKPLVSGTTGLSNSDKGLIAHASKQIPILHDTNMSFSLAVLRKRIFQMAGDFAGKGYACHIHEVHHDAKKDAPSGTAKTLAEEITSGSKNTIVPTITSARGGTVAGKHTITFLGPYQSITAEHNVEQRAVFASGAVDAAIWLAKQPKGRYEMKDVLGLT